MSCETRQILDYLRFLNFKKKNYYLDNGIDLIDILIDSINFNKRTNKIDRYEFIYNNLYIIKEYVTEIKKHLNDYDFKLFLSNKNNDNDSNENNKEYIKKNIIENEIELIKYYRSKIINEQNYFKFDLYDNIDTHLDKNTHFDKNTNFDENTHFDENDNFDENINLDLHLNSITPPVNLDYNNYNNYNNILKKENIEDDILIDLETIDTPYLNNYFKKEIKNHVISQNNIKKKKNKRTKLNKGRVK